MTRGPIPGHGKSHQRVLDALKRLGTEKDGRPKAIRSAELAAASGLDHGNLSRIVAPLIDSGAITACTVTLPRGRPTREFRLGPGVAAPNIAALDPRRAGVAKSSARPGQPLRVSATHSADGSREDATLLERVQRMDSAEFGNFVGWLAEVWRWSRQGRARGTA